MGADVSGFFDRFTRIDACDPAAGELPHRQTIKPKSHRTRRVDAKSQTFPIAAFETSDIEAEFKRLKTLGVAFTQAPTRRGPVTIAVFADTCGNLIQLYQPG